MLLSNLSRDSIERGVGYWLGKDIRLLIPLRCNILLEVASDRLLRHEIRKNLLDPTTKRTRRRTGHQRGKH